MRFLILSLALMTMNLAWAADSIGSPEDRGRLMRYDSVKNLLTINGRTHELTDDVAGLLTSIWVVDKTRLLPGISVQFTATQYGNRWLINAIEIPGGEGGEKDDSGMAEGGTGFGSSQGRQSIFTPSGVQRAIIRVPTSSK